MAKPLRRIASSLSAKLILTVCLLMTLGVGISWYVLITSERKQLMNYAVDHTVSYSDLIKKSVHYDMLTVNREAIQQTLENIGSRKDVQKIVIFDNRGKIYYSSKPGEVGSLADKNSPPCAGCHNGPVRKSKTAMDAGQWVIYAGKDGHRILLFVDRIINEPSCYTAACHVHSQGQRSLGFIQTEFSLFPVDAEIRKQILYTTLYAVGFAGITSVILVLFLMVFVQKPVSVLSGAMEDAARGDLTQRVGIHSEDEMGLLAGTFNKMIEDLQETTVSRDMLAEEVNQRKQIEEELRKSEKRYRDLFDSSMDGVFQVNADGIFTMMNKAGARIFGHENPAEIIGRSALQYWRDPKDRDAYRAELEIRKAVSAYPIPAKKKDGEPIELESSSMLLEDEKGVFQGIEGILRDVTTQRQAEEELRHLSVVDELTGLYNRRGFLILATQQIKIAERLQRGDILLYTDMDNMKWVNDTLGHKEGDRALIDIANILKKTLRASDIVARWGGDEFVGLALGSTEKAGDEVLARLQENLDAHNSRGNRPYKLSISVGLTRYDPKHPSALEELLERGDKLMYEQKQNRKRTKAG